MSTSSLVSSTDGSEELHSFESTNQPTVLVPLQVSAFVLNTAVATPPRKEGPLIAPITQPNYTFLRLSSSVLQPDILPFTDLHSAGNVGRNPRLFDLGKNVPRNNRIGVYLTWLMPRFYRSGIAATPTAAESAQQNPKISASKNNSSENNDKPDFSAPTFRDAPVRWMVVRVVQQDTISPDAQGKLPLLQAWVIESDRKRNIDTLDCDVDLQTDVSPFIDPTASKCGCSDCTGNCCCGSSDSPSIDSQAEIFIGYRADATGWKEDPNAPRVPISLVNSSNPLFADFQPHNGNVFSMCDAFEFRDDEGNTQKADSATADYYVLGWHSDETKDPFYVDPADQDPANHQAILNGLNMMFPPEMQSTTDVEQFIEDKNATSTRLICHGAIYNVEWTATGRPKMPADTQGALLAGKMPVGVGATALDALLAYVAAHKDDTEATADIQRLEHDLFNLRTLLAAPDDSVDGVFAAADELSMGNYMRASTGSEYHFIVPSDQPGTPPKVPTDNEIQGLLKLNQSSYAYEYTTMLLQQKQWELFGVWWEFAGDVEQEKHEKTYSTRVTQLNKHVKSLQQRQLNFNKEIEEAISSLPPVKKAAAPPAFQARDPTMIVGGIQNAWPADYLDKLTVRLQSETVTEVPNDDNSNQNVLPSAWDAFAEMLAAKLPPGLQTAAGALLKEFVVLKGVDAPKLLSTDQAYPLYHDDGPPSSTGTNHPTEPWRDRWNSAQPWFPLFVEWQAEYTHIPYDKWTMAEKTHADGKAQPQLQFTISQDETVSPLYEHSKTPSDRRTISGRVLILPQPNFSLAASLQTLFQSTPSDVLIQNGIDKDEQQFLLANLTKLSFLSAPMSGLTDHLLTLVQGTHIKPMMRKPNHVPVPLPDALKVGNSIGFTDEIMSLIGKETELTPYGSFVQFLGSAHSAFKPVTHGQLCFTQLNIIDRFGQAISAIDPGKALNPPRLYPAISDWYVPEMLENGKANTVLEDEPGMCEFIQLPPAINQPSRLCSWFLVESSESNSPILQGKHIWRPAAEWENPVWGWVVINYPDRGVQLFTQDGTFYREVRLGGQSGAATTPAWLPFGPPSSKSTGQSTTRLDALVDQMKNDPAWLKSFMDMLNTVMMKSPHTPSAYAEFLAAIVGKPLALTTMGWLLELSADALSSQTTLNGNAKPEKYLLPGDGYGPEKIYSFPMKLGDCDRSYDGLVGYFLPAGGGTLNTGGTELDYSRVHSYFGSGVAIEPINHPDPASTTATAGFPLISAFYPDPLKNEKSEVMHNLRLQHIQPFGAIIDPFLPVHAYTSILPPQPLSLPPWTWQGAMSKMTAFFRVGPVIVPQDAPSWKGNETYQVTQEKYSKFHSVQLVPGDGVQIPVGNGVGGWVWLQGYRNETSGQGSDASSGDETSEEASDKDSGEEDFLAVKIQKFDSRPRFDKTPYTALEGFLQLQGPITGSKDDDKNK